MTARRDLAAAITAAARTADTGPPRAGIIVSVSGPTAVADLGGGQRITCRLTAAVTPKAGDPAVLYWMTPTAPVIIAVLRT